MFSRGAKNIHYEPSTRYICDASLLEANSAVRRWLLRQLRQDVPIGCVFNQISPIDTMEPSDLSPSIRWEISCGMHLDRGHSLSSDTY